MTRVLVVEGNRLFEPRLAERVYQTRDLLGEENWLILWTHLEKVVIAPIHGDAWIAHYTEDILLGQDLQMMGMKSVGCSLVILSSSLWAEFMITTKLSGPSCSLTVS